MKKSISVSQGGSIGDIYGFLVKKGLRRGLDTLKK